MASSETTTTTNGTEEQPTSSTPTPGASSSPVKEDALKLAFNYLVQGKRHLVVKDFLSAIESLGESCRLLAELEPELSKSSSLENAEAHFFYGKALLEQSRIELGVFEGAEMGKPEDASEEDSEEENSGGDDDDEEEESEEMEATNGNAKSEGEAESSEATANGSAEIKTDEKAADSKPQESAITSTDEAGKVEESEVDLNAPSPSVAAPATGAGGLVIDNEVPSTSTGLTAEAAAEKQAEEELSNLELAWEVLEVAKIGFRNLLEDIDQQCKLEKTEEVLKELSEKAKTLNKRLADTHCLLGEVATESENYGQAIEEFKTGLEILSGIEGSDSREIAQYHFQMGLAYSFDKKFQDALASFRRSIEIIENRISSLKHKIETKQTAKDLGIELEENCKTETEEVQELTALLPELQEKISDTIDAEKESKKEEEETKQEHEIMERNSPVKNPNPPVANDISHLVKKKKKAEDAPVDERPVKKMCTEAGPSQAMDTTDAKNGVSTDSEPSAPASTTNGHPIAIDA